ncbi:S8 family serine peptidase [Paenibacillus terrigena]|uniref:S8 family serine peptidase n=1 Tax=Paenibacillus terrigena TaxID=369333 RepID=UPI00037421CB|nr:S8 family serine peptidase [Paenibacillus terrigena]
MGINLLTRKLSILSLTLGLVVGTLPGLASAANTSEFLLSGQNQKVLSIGGKDQKATISSRLNTRSNEKVRVIVQLTGQPAALGQYAARQGNRSLASQATESTVNTQQSFVLDEAADQGIDMQVNYQYNTVLNGFEVTIPANEIPKLAEIPGVKSIHENSTWYAVPIESDASDANPNYETSPLKQIGAIDAWKKGFTGKGLKIGVIDTGVDYTHPDIEPVYKGGYDSFYNDPDPYEEVPIKPEDDVIGNHKGFGGTYHGTHVAGTIIGQFANKTSDIVQKGVAYGAELHVYKVLGRSLTTPDKSTGTTAQVIDGIEHAVKDKMDVINLSLGSDAVKDVNSPDAIAINNAVMSGIVAVVASGNAGPGLGTMGAPATSQLAISVGAVTSESKRFSGRTELSFSSVTSVTYDTYAPFQVMAWQTAQEDFKGMLGSDPYEAVYVGLGIDEDYMGKDVAGKIALVSRGAYPFVNKIAAAKAHGAKAVVIFNGRAVNSDPSNPESALVPDLSDDIPNLNEYYGGNLGDSFDFIPTFDIRGKQGRTLARELVKNPNNKLELAFKKDLTVTPIPGDFLADFSSWGPNGDLDMSIKPDLMAPGVNILSTWPAYGKGKPEVSYDEAYNRISGTSMATPHVAGLALLLKQAHPEWTPADIRSALTNTADLIVDEDEYLYDVYQQGAGRANVVNALKTPALLQALEPITILDKNFNPMNIINYNSSASFGVVEAGSPEKVKNLQLKNTGSEDLTYEASVDWYTEHDGVDAALDRSTIAAAAGQTAPLQLKLNVGSGAEEGLYEGQVTVKHQNLPALHVPFVVYVGPEKPVLELGVEDVAVTNKIVYPNRNSQNGTELSFKISLKGLNVIRTEVSDLNDETLGFYTSDFNPAGFEPGSYKLEQLISNAYHPYDSEGEPIVDQNGNPMTSYLKDGVYSIAVTALEVNAKGEVVKDKAGNPRIYSSYTSYRVDNSTGGGTTPGPDPSPSPSPGPSTSTPAPSATVTAAAGAIIDQGLKQVAVSSKSTTADGVTTVTVADSDLKKAVESAGSTSAAVILSGSANAGTATKVTLTAEQIKQLQSMPSKSVIVVSAAGSAISIPVSVFAKAPAGQGFELVVKQVEDAKAKFAAKLPGAKVLGTPVAFEASWVKDSTRTVVQVPHATFIKRSFSIPGTVEPNTAGVLFEENGLITPVASVFTPQKDGTTIVTVSRPGFSLFAALSRTVKFDDITSSWAASDITALANKLIIDGTSETTFAPKNNLTRAEFTALLVRSLGLRTNSAAPTFSDVKGSEWYAGDIAAASQAGLIQGLGNGQFAPNANVTRQELTVILARALKLTGVELKASNPSFQGYSDDDQISDYAKESVKALSSAGIIGGDDSQKGQFLPTTATTRETVAAALHQLLTKIKFID